MKILIIDENLLMSSKLKFLSEKQNFETKVLSFAKLDTILEFSPDIIIINLESKTNDAFDIIKNLDNVKTIGYCSHNKINLVKKAKESGVNFVATNSSIVHNFDEILSYLNR